MTCTQFDLLLEAYLEGDLTQEGVGEVERHLLGCVRCAHEARSLEQTRAMLRDAVPAAEPSPAYRERATARLLDALQEHLRPAPVQDARQWKLPLMGE